MTNFLARFLGAASRSSPPLMYGLAAGLLALMVLSLAFSAVGADKAAILLMGVAVVTTLMLTGILADPPWLQRMAKAWEERARAINDARIEQALLVAMEKRYPHMSTFLVHLPAVDTPVDSWTYLQKLACRLDTGKQALLLRAFAERDNMTACCAPETARKLLRHVQTSPQALDFNSLYQEMAERHGLDRRD